LLLTADRGRTLLLTADGASEEGEVSE
jgi:hypothetical protein